MSKTVVSMGYIMHARYILRMEKFIITCDVLCWDVNGLLEIIDPQGRLLRNEIRSRGVAWRNGLYAGIII